LKSIQAYTTLFLPLKLPSIAKIETAAMRFNIQLVIYLLSIWMTTTTCLSIVNWKDEARVFFPEQVEYLRMIFEYCGNDEMILWGDGRCYREFERGPCYADRVLMLDREQFKPYCKLVWSSFYGYRLREKAESEEELYWSKRGLFGDFTRDGDVNAAGEILTTVTDSFFCDSFYNFVK